MVSEATSSSMRLGEDKGMRSHLPQRLSLSLSLERYGEELHLNDSCNSSFILVEVNVDT